MPETTAIKAEHDAPRVKGESMTKANGKNGGTRASQDDPSRARVRDPDDDPIEPLESFDPGTVEARKASLRNFHRLTQRALDRTRRWAKDGVEHEAHDPDVPTAAKCQGEMARILRVIVEGKPGAAAGDPAKSMTPEDWDALAVMLRAQGYAVGERGRA